MPPSVADSVAGQRQRLSGQRDAFGGEIGDFEQHIGRRLAAPAMLAAHDPRDVVDAAVVGDHRHRIGERILLAIERVDGLARFGAARDERTGQFGVVIDVAGAAEIEHHIVADVDERRDRTLPDCFETAAHPFGGGTVGDA